jgi:hypothetical protein
LLTLKPLLQPEHGINQQVAKQWQEYNVGVVEAAALDPLLVLQKYLEAGVEGVILS